jgi:hypothetical protein
MSMTQPLKNDQDTPWKELLEQFLPQFLAFFFPSIFAALDWSKGYESRDKELHQIARKARVGRRLADKLFKVWLKNGEEAWILIHIEIQGQREKWFGERMYIYNYRVYDRFRKPVVSLAVLCDGNPRWKPDGFGYNSCGCEVSIRFPVVKILEYRGREEQLETDRSPMAAVVLAQLQLLDKSQTPAERKTWKVRLIKGLYQRELKPDDVRELFRLIDWMLTLPDELEKEFHQEIHQFEEERRMPYVTSVERFALKKGLREGLLEGITSLLKVKFGEVDKQVLEEIKALDDVSQLRKVLRAVEKAKTLDGTQALMRRLCVQLDP